MRPHNHTFEMHYFQMKMYSIREKKWRFSLHHNGLGMFALNQAYVDTCHIEIKHII